MSKHNIRAYWAFCRVKIAEFGVSDDGQITLVKLEPDRRYLPLCSGCKHSGCKQKVRSVHSYHSRAIRDLPMGESLVVLQLRYRKWDQVKQIDPAVAGLELRKRHEKRRLERLRILAVCLIFFTSSPLSAR